MKIQWPFITKKRHYQELDQLNTSLGNQLLEQKELSAKEKQSLAKRHEQEMNQAQSLIDDFLKSVSRIDMRYEHKPPRYAITMEISPELTMGLRDPAFSLFSNKERMAEMVAKRFYGHIVQFLLYNAEVR